MTRHRVIITGVALLAMTGFLRAQTKSTTQKTKGSVHVQSTRMTGVVDWVEGNTLVAKMQPNGDYRVFIVPPEFVVEGKPASVSDLKKGMKVSATKIVEEPHTEFSTKLAVTGTSHK